MNTSKSHTVFEFVHRENVERLQRLLTAAADENERKQLLKPLAEQEAQQLVRERVIP
jgi:hypothetical protein